jgi:hypothetical protein
MRSPEDFPADIDRIAADIVCARYRDEEDMQEAIAHALMERDRAATERAAKIAEGWPLRDDLDEGDIWAVSMNIAAAIRSQP